MAKTKAITITDAAEIIRSKGYAVTWNPGTTTYQVVKNGAGAIRRFSEIESWAQTGRDPHGYFVGRRA